ncbi:hypothetical protein, partial [Pseudomonas aeruginosa]|uniref:hypothetical protein n=1 Tax=Pseudomonas aeruginosa TaxID=287 RepID=UPI001C7D0BF8
MLLRMVEILFQGSVCYAFAEGSNTTGDLSERLMAKADPEMQLAYTSHSEIPASSTNATHQPAVQNKLEQVVAE